MKVGITGHQDLGSEHDRAWVSDQLHIQVSRPLLTAGITSLAIGADQLYATLLNHMHKPYTVVVPSANYEATFETPDALATYRKLLAMAASTVQLPHDEPNEDAFWDAGKRVVEMADMMIAVWNGLPAKGLGGTADVVAYCLKQGKTVLHLNPRTHAIMEISP